MARGNLATREFFITARKLRGNRTIYAHHWRGQGERQALLKGRGGHFFFCLMLDVRI